MAQDEAQDEALIPDLSATFNPNETAPLDVVFAQVKLKSSFYYANTSSPPPLTPPSLDLPLQPSPSTPYTTYASSPNSFLSSCPSLKWGICGTGRICNDFTQSLKILPSSTPVACAAMSSIESAEKFGRKHGIKKCYGSYEELSADPNIQIVYVGNVHIFRLEVVEMMLKAGKHCLVEKPFACSHKDAKYLFDLAAEKNLFCSEGMWTRLEKTQLSIYISLPSLPPYSLTLNRFASLGIPQVLSGSREGAGDTERGKVRNSEEQIDEPECVTSASRLDIDARITATQFQLATVNLHATRFARRSIGEVVCVNSDFHFPTNDSEKYPDSPLYSKKLAGGASRYAGPYPIAAALCCFPAFPDKISCAGVVDPDLGVDLAGSMSLSFPSPEQTADSDPAGE